MSAVSSPYSEFPYANVDQIQEKYNGTLYTDPSMQSYPEDVLPNQYSNIPTQNENEGCCTCSECCLIFISVLSPIIGWILGCTLSNKKTAKKCSIAGSISFLVNCIILFTFRLVVASR